MQKFIKEKKGGFTIVETLVAVSIFSMSLLGIMSVLGSGVANTNYAKQKIAAIYLAQEGIEYIRNMRDTNVLYAVDAETGWSNFLAAPKACPSVPSGFTCTISTALVNPNEVKINASVSWTQGSGTHSIIFSENLFNWIE